MCNFSCLRLKFLKAICGLCPIAKYRRRWRRKIREEEYLLEKQRKEELQSSDVVNHIQTDFYESNPNRNKTTEYVNRDDIWASLSSEVPKAIAFYLPQFHRFPENSEWWGPGFTEWTNVARGVPQFKGHYQPHVPADLGFYDLSHTDVMYEQAEMARQYGIYGFCFHYYWFSGGHRLLEKPLFNYLNDKGLDFPFCLCWANEPWSRRWDGSEHEVLMAQNFVEDDIEPFYSDMKVFLEDDRYIKVEGKPVLIFYRPTLFDRDLVMKALSSWREMAARDGLNGLYLIAAKAAGFADEPSSWGFDAVVEFPPHYIDIRHKEPGLMYNKGFGGTVIDMRPHVESLSMPDEVSHLLYKTVFPSWDNTARRGGNGYIFHHCTPALYRKWLDHGVDYSLRFHPEGKRFVFINAWNEWGEGAHLEPDQKYGYAWLKETRDALQAATDKIKEVV